MAFSRVSVDLLEDDEDERRALFKRHQELFTAATEAQLVSGCTPKVLQRFRDAEAVVRTAIEEGGGLAGLRLQELETVLKGRLYQATILARLEEVSDRWPEVKSLAEDVLLYDSGNCHAHWLRGVALLNGLQLPLEAEQAMKKAVSFAKQQGKAQEAKTWEEEIGRIAGLAASCAAPAGSVKTATAPVAKAAKAAARAADAEETKTLKRGFLTGNKAERAAGSRGSGAAAAANVEKRPVVRLKDILGAAAPSGASGASSVVAEAEAAQLPVAPAAPAAPAASGAAGTVRAAAKRREEEAEDEKEAKRRSAEVEVLRAELATLRRGGESFKQAHRDAAEQLRESMDAFACELEEQLSSGSAFGAKASEGADGDDVCLPSAEASSEILKLLDDSKSWAELQHRKYMDFATELATLREMAGRDLRSRKDVSKRRLSEMLATVKTLGELRLAGRHLRDGVRLAVAEVAASEAERHEKVGSSALSDFRLLPLSAKVSAVSQDAALLRMAMLSALLGALMALGVLGEGFATMGCRFACAR